MKKVEAFFNPRSIAVVGASRNKDKLGYQILKNLIDSGFRGKIFPINPKAKSILGKESFPSVLNIKDKVDLAVFIVPREIIESVFAEAVKKRISAAIIITAGFGETGRDGKELEEGLLSLAKKSGMRVIGPNCLGIIDTNTPMDVSFAGGRPARQNLSVVSQSGAMCTAILDWAVKNCIGFSKFVSLGNKIDVDETEIFDIFRTDPNTKVALGYFEAIRDGKAFIEKARRLSVKKPIIAIKAGESKAGARAASSHTGALTSPKEAVNAAFRKAGVIRVNSIEELFDFSEVFSTLPFPKNNTIAVLTNAGGPGVLTADFIEKSPLTLAKISPNTKKTLRKNLPKESSVENPVDVIGDADAKRYQIAAEALLRDSNVASLLVLLTPQTSTQIEETAKIIVKLKKKYNKPVVISFIEGQLVDKGICVLEIGGVPNFEFPERAVRALSELSNYKKYTSLHIKTDENALQNERISKIFAKVLKEQRSNLTDLETKKVMRELRVGVAKSVMVKTAKGAEQAMKKVGYPAVAKIVSSEVIHKTEYGLVKTGITSEKRAREAFAAIVRNAKKLGIEYEGVMFYEMVSAGVELIIGAKKDKVFGPVLMFGLGGTYVELFRDTTYGISPLSAQEANEMIFGIKGHKLLTGYRGKEGVNIPEVKRILLAISHLVYSFPQIKELDINPLKVDTKKAIALDIKIILER